MAKSRFLGRQANKRGCTRTMVQVGVPEFVDKGTMTARSVFIGLQDFRTTFENDSEEQLDLENFKGFNRNQIAKFSMHRNSTEIHNQNAIKAVTYDEQIAPSPVLVQSNIVRKMDYEQIEQEKNQKCEPNKSNENSDISSIVSYSADANVNYTYAKSCNGGPLKANQTSGEVQCGICGVVRFYKSIAKTKKYGAYSCDSCRKFIAKSIENQNIVNRCNNERGIGQCRIPNGFKSQSGVTRILSTDSRCKACWLQMCLKRFKLPEAMLERLIDTLPREMEPVLLWILKKPKPWTINVGNSLQNKIIKEYKLQKEIISALRDEDSDNSTIGFNSNESDDENSDKSDSDLEYNTKKGCKRKKSKLEDKSNCSKTKKLKKSDKYKYVQSNGIKRVASLRSTNCVTPNLLETKALSVGDSLHYARIGENQPEKVLSAKEVASFKSLPAKYTKLSNSVNNEDIYLSIQSNRTLQDLMMQDHLNASIENFEDDKTIDLNFRESYDPDKIAENGFAIVGTKPLSLPQRAVCFLCGSAGMEKLIHCVSCCEPYHKFCVDGVGIGISSHESEWSKISWTCPKCKVCCGCQSRGKTRPKLTCQRCKDSYHETCLVDKLVYDPNRPWACPSCRKCKSCHVPRVDYFVGNLALCTQCFQLRQHGNYCPLCQNSYSSDDYESKMMECAKCKHWVHAKCESLSNEKYEVLSTLPDIIEYVCKICTTEETIPWRTYVDEALKSGFTTVLTILGKNKKTCDLIKWSPQKQSPGCVCKKLIVPKFPSLDGTNIITPNTIEIPKQCVCHGLEGWSKGTPALVTIKQKVSNNEYESICQFNHDMLNTIDKFNVPELRKEYKNIVTMVFPWFNSDFEKNSPCKSSYSSTSLPIISPPKFIPKLSLNLLNSNIKALQDIMGSDDDNYYLTPKIDDTRICQFCKKLGEGMPVREGRLLYCGDNVWAHANCALWSSEVFEEIDGSLQNVQLALSRGKLVRCVVCNEKGASVGCCYRNCVKTYHFQCARKVFCVFNENKTVYCNNHASDIRYSVKDFTLERLIYIEQEDLKHKRTESSEIHILIGSLYINSIGHLHPLLSDSVESIFPIDFKAKRYYWSTKEPWKLIHYSWTTKTENYIEKLKFDNLNYTIAHNKEQDEKDNLVNNCEQDVDINLFTSIKVKNIQNETLKRRHPVDITLETKRCKMDTIDCFAYYSYDTDTELKSTIDETCRMELFSNSFRSKSKTIPQVDGLYDSSDCESDFDLYKLDNISDVINDCTSEQPVKCSRCHRTYRTSKSYDSHLEYCDFDYEEIGCVGESSDDDMSDMKVEDDCLSSSQEQVLLVQSSEEDALQNNYVSVSSIQTSQQQQQPSPPSTVILQPLQTSFIQSPVPDVQYITINSTPPHSVMPCFQYQSPPTVIVQPPVVDSATVVLNNSPVDMFVSQSNNLLFSPQPMIVGLDQYNMSPTYTYAQSPQMYHSSKPIEPISNQYYIVNTEPTVSSEWPCNVTSETKNDCKMLGTQPKVYINRKFRSTESYDTKENIPNRLMQTIENQASGVVNIMRNVNPEPWKRQNLKTYSPKKNQDSNVLPKRIEMKKILPKCDPHSSRVSTSGNMTENTFQKSVVNATSLPIAADESLKHSPVQLAYSLQTTNISNVLPSTFESKDNASSLLRSKNKPPLSSVTSKISSLKKTMDINPKMCLLKCANNKSSSLHKLDNTSSLVSQHIPLIAGKSSSSLCLPVNNISLKVDNSSISKVPNQSSIPELEKQPVVNSVNKTLSVLNNETSSSKLFSCKNELEAVDKYVKNYKSTGDNKPLTSLSTSSKSSIEMNYFYSCSNIQSKNLQQDRSEEIVMNSNKKLSTINTSQSNQKNYPGRQWSSASVDRECTVPQLLFEMNSADGVFCKDRSLVEIWSKLFEAVQVSRVEKKMPKLCSSNPFASDITSAIRSFGLSNNFLKYLLEQLAGAKEFVKYKPSYHKGVDVIGSTTDHSGCARTNIAGKKNKYDMFSWLASRHRKPPKLLANHEDFGGRRANSLPNEMKYRNMNKSITTTVGVYRSDIHGRGLFCLRDIEQGEYVIEYTGEVIRSSVCDIRERLYNKKGIDCYMFRINQDTVVDATMNGNSSRFINHSCDPNCHSKIETIHGKKHIMILAKRKLHQGEELTYDYKFPLEDDKITCHCLSRKCRKYLN